MTSPTVKEFSQEFNISYKSRTVTSHRPTNTEPIILEETIRDGFGKSGSNENSTKNEQRLETEPSEEEHLCDTHSTKTSVIKWHLQEKSRNWHFRLPTLIIIIFLIIGAVAASTMVVTLGIRHLSWPNPLNPSTISYITTTTQPESGSSPTEQTGGTTTSSQTTPPVRRSVARLAPQVEVEVHRLFHLTAISNATKNVTIFSTTTLDSGDWQWESLPPVNGYMQVTVASRSEILTHDLLNIFKWLGASITGLKFDAKNTTQVCHNTTSEKLLKLSKVTTLEILNLNECFVNNWLKNTLQLPSLTDLKIFRTDAAHNYQRLLTRLLKRSSRHLKNVRVCDDCEVLDE